MGVDQNSQGQRICLRTVRLWMPSAGAVRLSVVRGLPLVLVSRYVRPCGL